jgi:hypothetical protein
MKKKASAAAVAAKGGLARAESLTKAERTEIAKRAAQERWAVVKGLPKETHTGTLKIGDGIPCSVLEHGKYRVLSLSGLVRAFGGGGKGRVELDDGSVVPPFLAAANVQPFISPELRANLEAPLAYRSMHGGRTALGFQAEGLADMCEALLKARAAGVLRRSQERVAASAEALAILFAKVGIAALIDEATGFQYDRARDELQRLLESYVVEDMRPWVSLFPDAFFKQVYRIHGWKYEPGVTQGPRYVGKFINRYVYERLPPGVLQRLRELNPVIGKRRKHKHFQFLSEQIGEPTVDRHLASVTTLMSVATDKRHFDDMFRLAFPQPGDQVLMGPVVNQATESDPEPYELTTPTLASTGRLEVVTGDASASERLLSMLRNGNAMSSRDLALGVYGKDDGGALGYTRNKLRKLLARLKEQGLVETPSPGIWKIVERSPA